MLQSFLPSILKKEVAKALLPGGKTHRLFYMFCKKVIFPVG